MMEGRAGIPARLMAMTKGEELALPVPVTRSGSLACERSRVSSCLVGAEQLTHRYQDSDDQHGTDVADQDPPDDPLDGSGNLLRWLRSLSSGDGDTLDTDIGVGGIDKRTPKCKETREGSSPDAREFLERTVGLPVVEPEALVIRSSSEVEYAA
jgi:hypothetical protein